MTEATVVRDGTTGQISLGPRTRKLTPGEAGFREDGGIPGLSCGDCRYYVNGECFIVDVNPDPENYCDEFQPALEKGRNPSPSGQTLEYLSTTKDLYITRVATDPKTGVKRWYATSSGIKRDAYGERMSVDLFRDFVHRIETSEPAPAVFASEAWKGGNPYLGVAHYLDLDGFGIVGDGERVYLDPANGSPAILKANGTFRDTPLAAAAYRAIQDDIRRNIPVEERVRISIAFVDYGHDHEGYGGFERKSLTDRCPYCERGIGEKVYKRGHLVHLALTRKPAYPETEIALEERSMTSKRDDAASIVGNQMADDLEKKTKLTQRSDGIAAGVIVSKSEEPTPSDPTPVPPPEPAPEPAPETAKTAKGWFGGATTLDAAETFLTKSKPALPVKEWDVLRSVIENISASPTGDKPALYRQALGDFQQNLDVLTARTLRDVVPLLAAGGKPMQNPTAEVAEPIPPAPEPEPTPTETPAEPVVRAEGVPPAAPAAAEAAPAAVPTMAAHPLDEALAAFKAAFDEAMTQYPDTGQRLMALQPALDALAEVVMRLIGSAAQAAVPPGAAAEAPAPAMGQDMAQMSEVQRTVASLAASVAQIAAAVEELKAQPAPATAVSAEAAPPAPPARPALVPRSQVAEASRRSLRLVPRTTVVPGAPMVTGFTGANTPVMPAAPKKSALRSMIRRSVGINESS